MGLYAEISVEDIGPDELTDEEFDVSVLVDYSTALQAFADTFMEVATSLCPIRTGYLCSTIDAGSDGETAYAEASAEYAEYVEYGTSYMDAQPYFEPALEEALVVLAELAQEALDEAQEMLEEMIASLVDEMMEGMSEMMGGGFGGFMGGLLASVIMLIVLFPIALYAYGIADTLSINGGNSQDSLIDISGIDIMIT